ncbi:MAG: EAL domain-containing protein, partial [Lachnospiraceae bacterium]|nr:EAL domain-containing protein [Lachnospiraceae bacterium]
IANGRSLAIIAIDINNLTDINEKYNRIGGDSAIIALAKFISGHTHEREICGRLSNDEFLIGIVDIDCDNRYKELISLIPEQGIAFYDTEQCIHYATLHHNMKTVSLNTVPDIDFIINQAVNDKNHAKKIVSQKDLALSEMSEEDIAKCNEVEKILDNNLLTFYFQPIVKAENGDIFGYEALMRYEGEMKLNPLEIIKYAASMNRLYDIEKLTFNGVLDRMEEDPAKFISKKVFINSLPAHQLEGEDEENLFTRFKRHLGRIVVEYTEASEFSDDDLNKRKADYSSLYVEIALDDYGSGYSNVNNLIRYNPRYVKVDHALIQGIDNNAQKRHFVKNIISYASKSNISVLAEGVETKEELRTVIDLGVNYIQGFYTGRPVKEPVQKISDEICSQMKRFSYGNDTSSLNFDDNLFG